MPPVSRSQQKYIYYLRNKYKTKKDTPDKYKWVWEDKWEKSLKRESKISEDEYYLSPYIKFFEDTSIFNLEEMTTIFLDITLDEGFFKRIHNVKDFLKYISKKIKKFTSKLYEPVKITNIKNDDIGISILYPDNRVGYLKFKLDLDNNCVTTYQSKGNDKYFSLHNIKNLSVEEFSKLIQTIAHYCYHAVFKNDYYDFSSMKNGKGIIIS